MTRRMIHLHVDLNQISYTPPELGLDTDVDAEGVVAAMKEGNSSVLRMLDDWNLNDLTISVVVTDADGGITRAGW